MAHLDITIFQIADIADPCLNTLWGKDN